MNTTIRQPINKSNSILYLPMQEFAKSLNHSDAGAYRSIFSFEPFLEQVHHNHQEELAQLEISADALVTMAKLDQRLLELSDPKKVKAHQKELDRLIQILFPGLFFGEQPAFIAVPYTKEFIYTTPEMRELLESDEWEVKVPEMLLQTKERRTVLDLAGKILNVFYGQNLDLLLSEVISLRNIKTGLERHYKINVIPDYVKVTAIKPPKKLTPEQIYRLLNEWDNIELWTECLPPENFLFEGMMIGVLSDVTDVEILSELKQMAVEEDDTIDPAVVLQTFEQKISSFLAMPQLRFGSFLTRELEINHPLSWSLLGDEKELSRFTSAEIRNSLIGKSINNNEPILVGDLTKIERPDRLLKVLINKDLRSLLIAPVLGPSGKVIGIFELAHPEPYQLNKLTLFNLKDVISFFAVGTNRWIQRVTNQTNLFIQEQFTAIHPSVGWKFSEVARKYLWTQNLNNEVKVIEPIVFKNIYPLYGQADIVGSSVLRNKAIQMDLMDNLHSVHKVLKACRQAVNFDLLDVLIGQVEVVLKRLENDKFISSDESHIVELLTREVHPVLEQIKEQFPKLPLQEIQKYFASLNDRLGIIYKERKKYEDSVSQLNQMMTVFIEKADIEKQELIPHFFEKFTTDGIEYNIYLGQSLLRKGTFSPFYLKDFRLWQLLTMCKITRLVAEKSPKLPIPLTTAQLIFVYNSPLSICFRMDEKKFDVDGAYNIRYEIIKKRIDKAIIKGTKERLTQSGKIAIVYLQEKDKQEYMGYLNHLIDKAYLHDNIEDVELEKLQGADGLRALRVTVKDEIKV